MTLGPRPGLRRKLRRRSETDALVSSFRPIPPRWTRSHCRLPGTLRATRARRLLSELCRRRRRRLCVMLSASDSRRRSRRAHRRLAARLRHQRQYLTRHRCRTHSIQPPPHQSRPRLELRRPHLRSLPGPSRRPTSQRRTKMTTTRRSSTSQARSQRKQSQTTRGLPALGPTRAACGVGSPRALEAESCPRTMTMQARSGACALQQRKMAKRRGLGRPSRCSRTRRSPAFSRGLESRCKKVSLSSVHHSSNLTSNWLQSAHRGTQGRDSHARNLLLLHGRRRD